MHSAANSSLWWKRMVSGNGRSNSESSVFHEFIGMPVKAPYRDGNVLKVARGVLVDISNGFVKISGELGTIIINEKNIEKMARLRDSKSYES